MKKEIVIDGKMYVLREEVTGKCDDLKFGKGDWIRKTWKDGSGDVDIFLLGEQIKSLRFKMNYYIRTRKDGNIDDLSKNQSDYCIDVSEPRWTLSKLEDSEIKDHLISEAKRRYPIGTRFVSPDDHDRIRVIKPYKGEKSVTWYRSNVNGNCIRSQNGIYNEGTENCSNPSVYNDGVWAEIIKEKPLKIGNHEVTKSDDGIEIGCEYFDNSELRTINRLFNICRPESISIRITGDELMIFSTKDGENLSTTSYKDLFKGTEIGNMKF